MENSSKNNVDEIFKDAFRGFENEPSERVWGNVREALKTRVRRGFYANFMGALLLLGIGGILTYSIVSNGSVSQLADKGTVSQPAAEKDAVASAQPVVVNSPVNAPEITEAAVQAPAITPAKPRKYNNNTPVTAEVAVNTNNLPLNNNVTTSPSGSETIPTKDISPDTESPKTSEVTATPAQTLQIKADAENPQPVLVEDGNDGLKKKDADVITLHKPKDAVVKTKMRSSPFTNPDKSGFAVIAYYAPEISYRTLSYGKDANLQNMIEVRNKFEKAAYAYSYGVKLEYQFKKHLALQVGLAYAERGENAAYDFDKYTIYKAGPFGQDVHVSYDTIYKTGKSYNKYQYIECPITATYWLGKGRSLFAVSGGISIGDLVGADVLLVGQADNDHMLLNEARYMDLKQTTFSALAGFSYSYKISPGLSIMLDPTFRFALNGPNSVVKVKEHQYSAGINLGLRYKFTSKN